jgi:hypothetical protein
MKKEETQILKLTLEQAKEIYKTAGTEIKQILELNFGKNKFITDKTKEILTFGDVLNYHGIKQADFFFEYIKGFSKKKIAFEKLMLIESCFNDGKVRDNYIYWPCFIKKEAGLVFCRSDYYGDGSSGSVASFLSKEDSDHVGKSFTSIYEDFIIS